MEAAFWNWLMESYTEGNLPLSELIASIEDDRKAYDLFMECWSCDPIGTGEMARYELEKFHRDIKKLNIKPPKSTDSSHGTHSGDNA